MSLSLHTATEGTQTHLILSPTQLPSFFRKHAKANEAHVHLRKDSVPFNTSNKGTSLYTKMETQMAQENTNSLFCATFST